MRTTGNSLQACQQILESASPKSIVALALAQTYYPDDDDPLPELYAAWESRIVDYYSQQEIELMKQFDLKSRELTHSQEEEMRALIELHSFAYDN